MVAILWAFSQMIKCGSYLSLHFRCFVFIIFQRILKDAFVYKKIKIKIESKIYNSKKGTNCSAVLKKNLLFGHICKPPRTTWMLLSKPNKHPHTFLHYVTCVVVFFPSIFCKCSHMVFLLLHVKSILGNSVPTIVLMLCLSSTFGKNTKRQLNFFFFFSLPILVSRRLFGKHLLWSFGLFFVQSFQFLYFWMDTFVKKKERWTGIFCCLHTFLHSCPGNGLQSSFCSQ